MKSTNTYRIILLFNRLPTPLLITLSTLFSCIHTRVKEFWKFLPFLKNPKRLQNLNQGTNIGGNYCYVHRPYAFYFKREKTIKPSTIFCKISRHGYKNKLISRWKSYKKATNVKNQQRSRRKSREQYKSQSLTFLFHLLTKKSYLKFL